MSDDLYQLEQREVIYSRLESGEISMGQAVRLLRKSLKLTQKTFAAAVGVDLRVLSDFERDQGNLRAETMRRILAPFALELTAKRRR